MGNHMNTSDGSPSHPRRPNQATQNNTTSRAYAACSDGTAAASLRSSCWSIQECDEDTTWVACPAETLSIRVRGGIQPSRAPIHGGAAGHNVKPMTPMYETAR